MSDTEISVICISVYLAVLFAAVWLLNRRRKDPIMATVQELTEAVARLTVVVDRAIPIIRDAGTRIDPAALDPVRDALNQTAENIMAVLPPQ